MNRRFAAAAFLPALGLAGVACADSQAAVPSTLSPASPYWMWATLAVGIALLVSVVLLLRIRGRYRLLEQALDRTSDAAFIMNGKDFVYVNEAACLSLGYSRDELLRMDVFDIDPDFNPAMLEKMRQQSLGGGRVIFETLHRRRDGSIFPVEITATHFLHKNETQSICMVRDITERKQMEEALVARERDFRSLAENIPDNVARWDTGRRLLYSNPTHQRTLGKSAAELIGKPLGEIFPDGRYNAIDEAISRIVATGEDEAFLRAPELRENGETRFHDVKLVPEFDAEGRIVSVLGLGRDMTEICRMQEVIVAREQEFRSLAESSPDFIVRYDRDGRVVYINAALLNFLGLDDAEEILGKRPGEDYPDGCFTEFEQAVARAVESGSKEVLELVMPVGSGAVRYHQIFVVPERDTVGLIVGVIAFGRDVTDIREAERRQKHFIDNLPGMAYTFRMSLDGKASFPFASPRIEQIFGLKPDEVRDDMSPLHALMHADDRIRIMAAVAVSAENLLPLQVESRVCRPGLPERWIELRSTPMRMPDGSIVWHGIMLDITERRRIEDALRTSEEKIRSLYELSPLGIALTDMRGRYIEFNEAFRAICGYPADELMTLDYWALTPEKHKEEEAKQLESLARSGRYGPYEKEYRQKDGSLVPIQLNGVLVTGKDGKQYIWSIVEDITGRKLAECELAESRAQLRGLVVQREMAREEERKFIAREIHDELGQILTGLKMSISVIGQDWPTAAAPASAYIKESMALTETAIGVVRNISAAIRPAELDMGIVAALRWQANRFDTFAGIPCEVRIEDEDIRLDETDSVAVFRIVQESLTNVVKHARASRVSIALAREGEGYLLEIADDGCGFDTGIRKRGSFGLVGMKERVLMLGGELAIDSDEGGTTIAVHFTGQGRENDND